MAYFSLDTLRVGGGGVWPSGLGLAAPLEFDNLSSEHSAIFWRDVHIRNNFLASNYLLSLIVAPLQRTSDIH